jgi:hypothetical protein
MSPHNYELKFNGSYNNANVQDQHDLANRFDMFLSTIGSFLYTISGLRFFYTRRIFKRGVEVDKEFPQEFLDIPLHKQFIGPNHGMVIHPSYLKKGQEHMAPGGYQTILTRQNSVANPFADGKKI